MEKRCGFRRLRKLSKHEPNEIKANLPIFAGSHSKPVGSRFDLDDGQTMEVVRQLSHTQVRELAKPFFDEVTQRVPKGTPVYWFECKPVTDVN